VRWRIWAAADIFTSLSDNIQESFGLAPIEAMAAGLPSVVSDWDGYRDTVRDGLDGFRIPTVMPPAGSGVELALRFASGADNYDHYLANTSGCVAVDVAACVEAYVRLIENAELRQTMGRVARQRAEEVFDWRVVVRAYQELWGELAAIRSAAADPPAPDGRPPHPLREDPFAMFANFATVELTAHTRVRGTPSAAAQLDRYFASSLTNYHVQVLAPKAECARILQLLARGPCTVREILDHCAGQRSDSLWRTLGWLAKCNLIQVELETD
jgi:hypothetical protein